MEHTQGGIFRGQTAGNERTVQSSIQSLDRVLEHT